MRVFGSALAAGLAVYVFIVACAWSTGWASAAGVGGAPGAHRPSHLRRPSFLTPVADRRLPGMSPIADAPKLTKAWRCKKRKGCMHCHWYKSGLRDFGDLVRQERLFAGPALRLDRWMFEPTLAELLVIES